MTCSSVPSFVASGRVRAGWSLTAFAPKVNYNKEHISRMETGDKRATEQFARACDRAPGVLVHPRSRQCSCRRFSKPP
ncbi:helix-turn-helix transcriptional regulator [Nonomuraea sp. NPDC046802]|uniref:helix-turn-helix transcriptional regulator n=1 Tax=Nonomuraea sp. NPDC046802 TaxID=3154919 RepID=UPI0033D95054